MAKCTLFRAARCMLSSDLFATCIAKEIYANESQRSREILNCSIAAGECAAASAAVAGRHYLTTKNARMGHACIRAE